MNTIPYPLRIPRELLELAKHKAKEEHADQATALRQILYLGAEEYVLHLVESGRISIGRAAELLGTTIFDIHLLAQRRHIEIGATPEQQAKSAQTMYRLLRKAHALPWQGVKERPGKYGLTRPKRSRGHSGAPGADRMANSSAPKDIIRETAGLWEGMKGTGAERKNRIRKGWRQRRAHKRKSKHIKKNNN